MHYDTANMTDKQRRRHYEVEDALHTMRRASEIVGDKKLMAEVKAMAKERAEEMAEVAKRAGQLAMAGRISPKAMAKMSGRSLEKTTELAKGNEGDSSETQRGIVTK